MCGICGIVNTDSQKPADRDVLQRMTNVMIHRGPDDEGSYLKGNVGLGFRRLSIVDLAAGHQPMCNEKGDVWIVFNGEIYNHAELRADLKSKGHVYRTRSDTETIVHLYEEEGLRGFEKMVGMFALAIWDDARKQLILLRDRLGIKPLYYLMVNDCFVFASEIKSILENPIARAEVNERCLHEQLIFRYVAGEDTPFKSVKKLLPGHILVWEGGKARAVKFWDVHVPERFSDLDEPTAIVQLEERLRESVRLRLMSDVPLGTFCSGGVDSGLTTAYAKQEGDSELNTFSIGFHEKEWDETHFAGLVSQRYRTNHHVIKTDNRSYADLLPQLVWYHDEPLYHPSSVLAYQVSKIARQHVTVVLTGEGADELFGGYPRYNIVKLHRLFSPLPGPARKAIGWGMSNLPLRRLNKFSYFLPRTREDAAIFNSQYVLPEVVQSLLTVDQGDLRESTMNYRLSLLEGLDSHRDRLTEYTMYLDLKTYIPASLHRQDKMSMAASIESRVPFLDHRLVEWGMQVPLSLKMKGSRNKYVVKKLGERLLPREAIYRRKSGFGVPLVDWFRDPEGMGRYLELFSDSTYDSRSYIRSDKVRKMVAEHRAGKHNHAEVLWNLVNLELWHRIFIDKSVSVDTLADPRKR